MERVAGVLLAAGAGRRYGGPKALIPFEGTLLVERAVRMLAAGGCSPVLVVLGAAADEVRARADLTGATVVPNDDWPTGLGSSLRAGLNAAAALDPTPTAAVVALVDQPGVTAAAVRRLIAAAGLALAGSTAAAGPEAGITATAAAGLAPGGSADGPAAGGAPAATVAVVATYGGRPGHPVLLVRGSWAEVGRSAVGDRGARDFLRAHTTEVLVVPCDDVGSPEDVDTPADLARLRPGG